MFVLVLIRTGRRQDSSTAGVVVLGRQPRPTVTDIDRSDLSVKNVFTSLIIGTMSSSQTQSQKTTIAKASDSVSLSDSVTTHTHTH